LSNFGIGALYELRTYKKGGQWVTSVIIAGLEDWEQCYSSFEEVREPVLEHALKVGGFRVPPEAPDDDSRVTGDSPCPSVPAFRFPEWLVCNKCNRLGKIGNEFAGGTSEPKCSSAQCSGTGVQVRLVSTCFDDEKGESNLAHPGHLDEFPWHWWAKSGHPDWSCEGKTHQLKLTGSGRSAALSGLRVECHHPDCKKAGIGRSLSGVFGTEALSRLKCYGRRPWLHDREECTRPVRAIMRGASNTYFPVTASAISIPPISTACKVEIGKLWRKTIKPALDSEIISIEQVEKLVRFARNASYRLNHFSDSQIVDAIRDEMGLGDSSDKLPATEADQRAQERTAIVEGRTDCDDSGDCLFKATPLRKSEILEESAVLANYLDHLVLVQKLREVRALRGFQRLKSDMTGDAYTAECAPLSKKWKNWLPAIQVYGEGIYFELNHEKVREWQRIVLKSSRFKKQLGHYHSYCRKFGSQPDPEMELPSFVLIHTLAHLLINQLSLDCGYSSASLRERLYLHDQEGNECYGVLIYTSSSSADGTLGGLVRQGNPDVFSKTFEAALSNATWCSSDPLCIESDGQGADALNLAACHGCSIISETSCEHRNVFLDRGLVIGDLENPELGFFNGSELIRI